MNNPKYNPDGELICGGCGKVLARSQNRFGDAVASCSDIGCSNHGKMIEEGSIRHNPMIPTGRRNLFSFEHPSRFYGGAATYIVKDGKVVSR